MPHALDVPPTISPMERHGQIEVDVFCTNCFYNLHGQVVTIDPRLNFPVCRCPECGKFHPAGTGVTSSSVWVRRLASILLFIWVAIVGAGVVAISLACFGLSTSSVEAFTYYVTMPGKNQWVFRLHPWQAPTNYETNVAGFSMMMWISAGSLAVGFLAGMLCVTLLWHWQRGRYVWTMVLPLIATTGLAMIYRSFPNYDGIRMQCMLHVLSQTGIQSIGILLGVTLGRKVSRTIIRMVIPPKPRQMLAFMWTVDRKNPPTILTTTESHPSAQKTV